MGIYLGTTALGSGSGGGSSVLSDQLGLQTITEGGTDYQNVVPFEYDSVTGFSKAKILTAPGNSLQGTTVSDRGFGSYGSGATHTAGWNSVNVTSNSNNDVWFTLIDDTSGGGIMHWVSSVCQQSHTGGTPGTTNAELKLKITVDGNTPIEITEYDSIGSGLSGASIFVGAPYFRGTIDSTNGLFTPPSVYYPQQGAMSYPTYSSDDKIMTFARNVGHYSSDTPIEVFPANVMAAIGIPSFKYETSLKIEVRADLNRSYATNFRYGGAHASCCVTEFD